VNTGLSTLQRAADALPHTLTLFVRDDDAGWDDDALLALLDVMATAGAPIDLAVIPQALGDALARELADRHDAEPVLLGLHQHGLAHLNHEPEGRKSEFGAARPAALQLHDLRQGQVLLREHLGARLDRIFTPPWNRIAGTTPALLAEAGFELLSRDNGACRQQPQPWLRELPVHVDWSRHHREGGLEAVALALAQAMHAQAAEGLPLGLMLHHAAMAAAERAALARWLAALVPHPRLQWQPMRAVQACACGVAA
jgi:predicted deacetylase